MRGLGVFLPDSLRLVDDPYGLRFAGRLRALRDDPRAERRMRRTSRAWMRGRLRSLVLYMQLRTRVIDDDVAAFAHTGGRQVVVLGAGFDCRAWRLGALADATVYEVDHPATQAKKRAVMSAERPAGRVVFVPWNFESDPLYRLPARLGLDGHDARDRTMTILEGVLPYLSKEATEETFACVSRYSAPDSPIALTYMDQSLLDDPSRGMTRERMWVRWLGEPFRSAFDPAALGDWLSARGFRLLRNESGPDAASRLLGADAPRAMMRANGGRRHFALAYQTSEDGRAR